ncbi:MAG: PEP-CTERM sorting domain-containing protein [Verrucomicrobiales bacterium]|nr:PEP-CTERM sorting domain-containing protein [Verrucomicrobiales bacterium]
MKYLTCLLSTACLLALAPAARATVTLQFSTSSAKLTGIADEFGVVTDGMMWGIIIDTAGDGFDTLAAASYDEITTPLAPGLSQFLAIGGTDTDDLIYIGSNLTATLGGTDGGSGGITLISNVPFGTDGISQGDAFAITWFADNSASAGSHYGMLTDPALTLPSDSSTASYAAAFSGADAPRPADHTFAVAPVPEPGGLLLIAIGGIQFLWRRRRLA